jgi:hypothetical protein
VTVTGGDAGIQAVTAALEASNVTVQGVPGSRFALLVSSPLGPAELTLQNSTLRNWGTCIQATNNASAVISESNLEHCGISVATGAGAQLSLLSNVITSPDLTGVPAIDPNQNIQISAGATAQIEDNDLLGCGELRCFNITGAGTSADIVDNRITLPVPLAGAASSAHAVMLITAGANASVLGNAITGCWRTCINLGANSAATIGNNTITIPADFPGIGTAIASFPGPNPANAATVEITNNSIEALGAIGEIFDFPSYPIGTGIRIDNTIATDVSGNTIRRAAWGIQSLNGSDIQSGRDNVIDQTLWPIRVTGYSPSQTNPVEADGRMTLRFSDITSYVQSIWARPGDVSSVLTCNYWGPAGAPQQLLNPGTDPSIYTPWATGPIARTGASGC